MFLLKILENTGHSVLQLFEKIGDVVFFALRGALSVVKPPFYPAVFFRQCTEIGFFSLPVIGLTTLFTGMVLAIQAFAGIEAAFASRTIPPLVVLSITRELSPVLTGLMIAGRIGSSMAAEIGSMRVSEQIDALWTMCVDPFRYLVAPRMLAAVLMLPLLVAIGDSIGVMGGYIVSVYQLNILPQDYIQNAWDALSFIGVFSGLFKGAVFGFIIATMGTYMGFRSKNGATGVGAATIQSVVISSIAVLIANYVISVAFFGK